MRIRKEQLWQKDSWSESGLCISTPPCTSTTVVRFSIPDKLRQIIDLHWTLPKWHPALLYVATTVNVWTCVCVCQWKTNNLSQSLISLHRYKGWFRQRDFSQPMTGWQNTHAMTAIAHIAINICVVRLKRKNRKRTTDINKRLQKAVQPSVSLCLLYIYYIYIFRGLVYCTSINKYSLNYKSPLIYFG